jgi:hypothetical protein
MSINASLRSASAREKKHRTKGVRSRAEVLTARSKKRLPSLKTQTMHRLYLKRRSQRANALKKVIKQWQQLQHTEWFFGTLEAWRSATEGHDFVPDHFLDLIADVVQGDESSLDVAVDRLAAANKRVHEAIEAMDRKLYSDSGPTCVVKAPGGKYDLEQVRGMLIKLATNPSLSCQAALRVLDRAGGGVKAAAEFRIALGAHMNRRGLGARRDAQPLAAKAPGGKYNYGQVSDIVRNVATNPKLGRQSAVDILDRDGGGVANVSKLKPENLDKVYEACRVLLVGEGLLPTPSIN